jgi:hypothetical protein
MKDDNQKKFSKNRPKSRDRFEDEESIRQRKTSKDFKRKKQSIQEDESWEDWSDFGYKND